MLSGTYNLNIIFWMVSTRHLISKSFSPFIIALVTLLREPITIGINANFSWHSFSIPYQGLGTYPSFHFLSILLSKIHNYVSSLFSDIIIFITTIIYSLEFFFFLHQFYLVFFFTGIWVTANLLKSPGLF